MTNPTGTLRAASIGHEQCRFNPAGRAPAPSECPLTGAGTADAQQRQANADQAAAFRMAKPVHALAGPALLAPGVAERTHGPHLADYVGKPMDNTLQGRRR
jgi:hypothetical protein